MNILRLRRSRKRFAISEVMGSLLMIAITLIAGAAVFGFVNGASGSSAQAVGQSAAANSNFLNEREVIQLVTIGGPSLATVYVYNNGAINPEHMVAVEVYRLGTGPVCTLNSTNDGPNQGGPFPVAVNTQHSVAIPIDLTQCPPISQFIFAPQYSYVFRVQGLYGSSAQVTQAG